MRLIDAEVLWDALSDIGGCDAVDVWAQGYDAAIGDALRLVETAPTVIPAPRWIPAEERLPNVAGRPVLVCTLDHYATWRTILASITQRGWWDGRIWRRTEGTYWMPLPEPPEEATQ